MSMQFKELSSPWNLPRSCSDSSFLPRSENRVWGATRQYLILWSL